MKTAAAVSADLLAVIRTRTAGGWMRLYEGSRPASPDAATGTAAVAEIHLGSPSFAAASGNSMAANPAASSQVLTGSTSPTWARFFESDGTTAVCDATIGASGELQISVATLVSGLEIDITGMTFSIPQT